MKIENVEYNTKVKVSPVYDGEFYTINIPIIEFHNGVEQVKTVAKEWFIEPKQYTNRIGVKRQLSPQAQNLALYLAIVDNIDPQFFEEKLGAQVVGFVIELIESGYLTLKNEVKEQKKTEKK